MIFLLYTISYKLKIGFKYICVYLKKHKKLKICKSIQIYIILSINLQDECLYF